MGDSDLFRSTDVDRFSMLCTVPALYPREDAKSVERRSERSSVMHKDSGVISWITDYKDGPHFVCVERSVLDRQQSSTGLPQETELLPTAQSNV